MKVTKEQAMAYTEVIEVLKYMPKEEQNKIPKEIVKYYKDNMDTSYSFKIDIEKTFEEQNLLEKTKIVLAILFRDYWATEEQREKIKNKEEYDIYLLELEKQEKYNSDNIFKERKEPKVQETKALIEYKEQNWYDKFFEFMKKIFGIKK